MVAEYVDSQWQALSQWQSHRIHQTHGSGTCSAVGTVDSDEVWRVFDRAPFHVVKKRIEPTVGADDCLEPDRLVSELANAAVVVD